MLFNKYKPKKLDDIKHNKKVIEEFKNIKSNTNHYIIYGLSDSGKYTILMAYINSLFNYDNLIYEKKDITLPLNINNSVVEVKTTTSNYHFEINCEDFNDKRIVNHFIKSISNTYNIVNNNKKIIIVKHLELLNVEYQWMLRRTIENIYNSCRIFFISNHLSKIDNSIISRCLCIRVELPTEDELYNIVEPIIENEKLSISKKQLENIVKMSNRRISSTLIILEYSVTNKKYTKPILYYHKLIDELIENIHTSSNLNNILEIRNKLHFIILYDYNLNILFEKIFNFYINLSDLSIQKKLYIIRIISSNNTSLTISSKKLYHLESMVCNIILVLNTNDSELNLIENIINFY